MRRLPFLAAALAAAALPAAARADTYCVQTPGCGTTYADLQAALGDAKAHAGPDRVEVGAGLHERVGGFSYSSGTDNAVEIVGQGDATVLHGLPPSSGASTAVRLDGSGTVLRRVRIAMPEPAPGMSAVSGAALDVQGGVTVEDVSVTRAAQLAGAGVLCRGDCVLRRLDVDGGFVGVGGWGMTLDDSRVAGDAGVIAYTSPAKSLVTGSRIAGRQTGIADRGAVLGVRDTLVSAGGLGVGLSASVTATPLPATIHAEHVTVVGHGTGVGVRAESYADGAAEVRLDNSMVAFFEEAIGRKQAAGAGSVTVVASHSVLPPGFPITGVLTEHVLRLADPGFADPAAGDFTPAPGSPALDSGSATPPGGLTPADLLGRPRPADGDGDGMALPDPGAFERQPASATGDDAAPPPGAAQPPPGGEQGPVADTVAPVISDLGVRRRRPAVRFSLSEAARVRVTVTRRAAGRRAVIRRVERAAAAGRVAVRLRRRTIRRAGRYRVAVVATDAAGNGGAPAATRFRVGPR